MIELEVSMLCDPERAPVVWTGADQDRSSVGGT